MSGFPGMNKKYEWLRIMVAVAVGCALFRLCDGEYEPQSILCDDVEAICSHADIKETNITECGSNERKFLSPNICNCGLTCIENLKEGDSCTRASLSTYPTKMCGPGLECKLENLADPQSSICMRNPDRKCVNESLIYEEEQEQGTLGPGRNKPNCDEYGFYAPRQCTPSSTCYCVNPEGKRVFGEGPFNQEDKINCECSLYWEEITRKGLNVGMRCLPNGNFDPLQCIDGYCFCYNDTTKAVTYGPVSISMTKFMPCYNTDIHYESYTNPCHAAQEAWDDHGTGDIIVSEAPRPVCSADGYYAAVQYLDGISYCADINGNRIEDYQLSIHEAEYMNCRCPRRRKMMEENGYGAIMPKCCSNGQYFPWQTRGPHAYCVDENGNQYGKAVTITNIIDLPCYTDQPCQNREGNIIII